MAYARTNNVCEVIRRWPVRWHGIPVQSRLAIKATNQKFVREGTWTNDQQVIQNAFNGIFSRAQWGIQAQGHAFPDE